MTIRQFRTLIAIAEHVTFRAAADQVGITHAAVSQQMKSLETQMGLSLFDRTARSPELTPQGWQVVEKARQVVADYDAIGPSVLARGGVYGVVKLGAISTTLTGLVPQAASVLNAQHPQLGLHIRPGLTGDMIAEIERGNLDAALVTKPQSLRSGLVFQALGQEPMVLVTAPGEPTHDPVTLLTTHPYIRFNRNAVLGMLIDSWLTAQDIKVIEAMELDTAEAVTSMVQQGLGVSIMPRLLVGPLTPPQVHTIDLGPSAPARTLGIVSHKDQPKAAAIDAIFQAMQVVIGRAKD